DAGDDPGRDFDPADVDLAPEHLVEGREARDEPARTAPDLSDRPPSTRVLREGLANQPGALGIHDHARTAPLAADVSNRGLPRPAAALERRAHPLARALRLDLVLEHRDRRRDALDQRAER